MESNGSYREIVQNVTLKTLYGGRCDDFYGGLVNLRVQLLVGSAEISVSRHPANKSDLMQSATHIL